MTTTLSALRDWVDSVASRTQPDQIVWCDGSEDEYRSLLGIPEEVESHYLTPLGYPTEFPEGLRPAVAKSRRPWRTLVHDEAWGNPRAEHTKA